MKIYDFTSRLPGPLATSLLLEQGFEVIKIENLHRKDPFANDLKSIFYFWYQKINKGKEIRRIDFSNQTHLSKLHTEIIGKNNIILTPDSNFFKNEILPLNLLQKHVKIFTIKPSHNPKSKMHDAEFLYLNNFFHLQENISQTTLPILPWGGMSFAQLIALTITSKVAQNPQSSGVFPISMKEHLSQQLFKKLLPTKKKISKVKMDHAGSLLCYHTYELGKKHFLFLTALERKTYLEICQKLNLPDRYKNNQYSRDEKLIKSLEKNLQKIGIEQLEKVSKRTRGINIFRRSV